MQLLVQNLFINHTIYFLIDLSGKRKFENDEFDVYTFFLSKVNMHFYREFHNRLEIKKMLFIFQYCVEKEI